MEKEKWKDEVMNSLQGLQPAEPNPFLFTRIEARFRQASGLSTGQIRLAGLGLVLIVVINIWAIGSNIIRTENTNSLTTNYRY